MHFGPIAPTPVKMNRPSSLMTNKLHPCGKQPDHTVETNGSWNQSPNILFRNLDRPVSCIYRTPDGSDIALSGVNSFASKPFRFTTGIVERETCIYTGRYDLLFAGRQDGRRPPFASATCKSKISLCPLIAYASARVVNNINDNRYNYTVTSRNEQHN